MPASAALTAAATSTVVLLAAASLAACSSGSAASPAAELVVSAPPTAVTVTTTAVPGLGDVLTSGGRPLYVFSPDHHAVVTCTGVCAGTWPPLRIDGGAATASGAVPAAALKTVTSDLGPVVTFDGWPLYFYAADTDATRARGQALFLNGGPWYTIRADGEIVTTGAKIP